MSTDFLNGHKRGLRRSDRDADHAALSAFIQRTDRTPRGRPRSGASFRSRARRCPRRYCWPDVVILRSAAIRGIRVSW